MILIAQAFYPAEKSMEVAKVWTEQLNSNRLPEGVKENGPFFRTDPDKGMVAMSFYEVSNESMGDAFLALGKRMVPYSGIPGFIWSIHPWVTAQEAMNNAGIEDPRS